MAKVTVTLNGTATETDDSLTILEVARAAGIEIPTFCQDDRLEPQTRCFLCVVEVTGARSLVPSCGTKVRDGMNIETNTPRVVASRKTALELIMSDHYGDCIAPCKLRCPAGVDAQGYIGLIAQGRMKEAIALIKERIPLPCSIGRVCPRFCEEDCRRQFVDESIAINFLKRFAADTDIATEKPYLPQVKPDIGKRVAIIGGGPAGLSAAYYLRQEGVSIDIYERNPNCGGMIYYGVPDYRLPRDLVEQETATITALGMNVYTGQAIGRDFTLADMQAKGYDAIILATGASLSRPMRIPGEDLENVLDSLNYLEMINCDQDVNLHGRVAVIGGGNTAFDCARTALRLGAEEVRMVYRRTMQEMPANEFEKIEADEEGVIFELLTIPLSIEQRNDNRLNVTMQKMELGAPDESGRRRPVAVENSEFTETFDFVISAIGLLADYSVYGEATHSLLAGERWIQFEQTTGLTGLENIFVAGDLAEGASTVVEAIASGRRASDAIVRMFSGLPLVGKPDFYSTREDLTDSGNAFFKLWPGAERQKPALLEADVRKTNFIEIESRFTDKEAKDETDRCMECGCMDVHQCMLKEYGEEYEVDEDYYAGEMNISPVDDSHPYLYRDPSKCILCGRCVDLCRDKVGVGVYGFIARGFVTEVAPQFGQPLAESDCISCGTCISGCPVGAIVPKTLPAKLVPLQGIHHSTICSFCSVGCELSYEVFGDTIYDVHEQSGFLCKQGRFNYPMEIPAAGGTRLDFLTGLKECQVFPSPSLSAEDYEMIRLVAEKQNWQIVNYYAGSTLWQAFAGVGHLPAMDWFSSNVVEKTAIICAGNIEKNNPVAINRVFDKRLDDTIIYQLQNDAGLRLNNAGSVHYTSIDNFKGLDLALFSEVVLLINPVTYDREYGSGAALDLYNHLATTAVRLRTTLFSEFRNLYSFKDAHLSKQTNQRGGIFIGTQPVPGEINSAAIGIERVGWPFQSGGTFYNSRIGSIVQAAVLENGFEPLHKHLAELFSISETQVPVSIKTVKHEVLLDGSFQPIEWFPVSDLAELKK